MTRLPPRPRSTPLHVLQLGSPTGLYGAERWILALLRSLDASKIRSTVAVVRDDPALAAPLCERARAMGIDAVTIDAFGRINPEAVRGLRRLMREREVDVLHTHGYKGDAIGLLATLGTGCRLVATPHGWSANAGWKLRAYEAFDRAVLPLFDAVVPLSRDLYDGLAHGFVKPRGLRLIANGVDVAEIDATGAPEERVRRWKEAGRFVVGYVGQLIARKGVDVLLRAFARVSEGNDVLVVLGEGECRPALEAEVDALGIADRVWFAGFRDDRLRHMKGFDALVLPSRLEGIPRCVMEAMAMGVPVIASDIPGCRDVIEHERSGLLFPVDDVDALAAGLRRMRADPSLRTALASRAKAVLLAEHSAVRMAREYESLYASLATVDGRDASVPVGVDR